MTQCDPKDKTRQNKRMQQIRCGKTNTTVMTDTKATINKTEKTNKTDKTIKRKKVK